ncbi:MAG: flagellar M-ring protein FliF [Firmicutes bacterium]|nr:flagellar M-ring protein FliF [Bacillota bacterium]
MAEASQEKQGASLLFLWKNLSMQKKGGILIFLVAFLVALFLFINFFSTPKMGLLFRGLTPDSAASVLGRLDEMGIAYELSAGGQEIRVSEDRIDELRIILSSDGSLYGSSVGFELFDQSSIGISESERRLNYQRALQGELQRTIAQIDGISQARVHLVTPEPSVFLRETSAATASVVVKLNHLNQLKEEQIMGIVYLVAGSVQNLSPENVTLIDAQGRILSSMGQAGPSSRDYNVSSTMSQLEIKKTFEKELESRLQGMLERVLGGGTVVAMVNADLDFDSQEMTEITYGEPALRSRTRTEEDFEGSGGLVGGNTGADSNIPSYPTVIPGQEESTYTKFDEIENFEISETLTHTIKAPGEVKNISASVIYDNSRGTLSARQMQDLEGLVASALGLSGERNDQVSIAAIDFDTAYLEESIVAMEEAAKAERTQMYIKYGLTGIAVIAGILLLLLILGRLKSILERQVQYKPVTATLPSADLQPVLPQSGEMDKYQNRVKAISQQNPETAIALLKLWLAEDQR